MSRSAAVPRQRESYSERFALLVEELTAKLQAGEAIDVEAFLQAHPEDAEQLRRLLPALLLLAEVSRSGDGPAPGAAAGSELGELGDFRLIREVGRGGMGVVYEAEQISLGRRVALKVLPFAATMDPRQLQRFHNEARAAASLHHEHIVPVYAVGCERAVHFYAMQFIEGQSLAELIAAHDSASRGRPPSQTGAEPDTGAVAAAATEPAPRDAAYFRRVAAWGIEAAEALEHAHALGIVHRDVKPANLIVDGRGKLWVTDFGLARTLTDAGLTMTGDVVGTLRYMSPEQALARHGLMDHRSDVYSLGATLYELLTGRPAVEGQDRQDILRRIAEDEPQPPRAVDRAVPADLETVVLKALGKEPAERYATAQELADDLARWLRGSPVQARSVSRLSRLWRWCRRNRAVASLLAAVIVLAAGAIIGLSIATAVIWREQKETKAALAEAETNYARAEAQRRRAENNFGKVLDGMTVFLEELDGNEALDRGQRVVLRKALADHMEQFFQQMQEGGRADPVTRMETGWAYLHLGAFYLRLDDYAEAERKCRQALAVLEPLVTEYPDDLGIRWAYSTCLVRLGTALFLKGDSSEARDLFRRAFREYQSWVDIDPSGRAHYEFTLFLTECVDEKMRDPAEALRLASRLVELAPEDPDSWEMHGEAHFRSGDWQAARLDLEQSLRLRGTGHSWAYLYLAMTYWRLGEPDQARQYYHLGLRRIRSRPREWHNLTLRRLRAEATTLLGVQEPATPKDKEGSPRKD